jgi:sn-glycerol 3-phosphate transport system ATP-binding protein
MEVYENPQTRFVAGFIGSPAMNFLPGKASGEGRVTLDHGGVARVSRVALESGRAMTVGIRPEHLVPAGDADAILAGPVAMVEQLGADALVHIRHGEDIVIVRVPHGSAPEVASTYAVTADPARVFAFDPTSGARLS